LNNCDFPLYYEIEPFGSLFFNLRAHPEERLPAGRQAGSDVCFSFKNYLEENITMSTSSKRFEESWLEGSHEILPRFTRQDDGSGITPTHQIILALFNNATISTE